MSELAALSARLRAFAAARKWEPFHTPKNLAMALAGEAGEVLAELQWLSDAEISEGLADGELKRRLADEAADVFLYLMQLADASGIDLLAAAHAKMDRNELRFPA
ncbi:nucleotide pyrophosphohydrolase [Allokutzneria sp. A3M-2-11 16]|uniref:nucleotide pyrophosphohydrolase n=1 Tax=Allokutzneria sp. A3M-2-11 16 TaxID=2962043 RepID=UPI0020B6CF04|nr:nucleotide pyrophosphohydrolase [Allokutzneria sp. A3M-2-11 16]MCP3800745.1 nucleotide pyrophosphohydrolase [Allokutzneria sp. A3M-2-11 16]